MEYKLKVNQNELSLDYADRQADSLSVEIGGKTYLVEYTKISTNRLHLNVEQEGRTPQALNVYVANGNGGKVVAVNGAYFEMADMDALKNQKRKNGTAALPDMVTPPIPAVVVACRVNVGDDVERGQEVVVLSAMKMETILVAPYSGKVTAVNAAEGDKVSPGEALVTIEKKETDTEQKADPLLSH